MLTTRTSDSSTDPAWDDFLAGRERAVHGQSTEWSRVRATSGWSPVRVILADDDVIVGGAQLMHRRVSAAGAIGVVSRGPVLSSPDRCLAAAVVGALVSEARRRKIRHLVVQPPDGADLWAAVLPGSDFVPSPVTVAPEARVSIDLTQSLDEVRAGMKSKTRANVKRSGRRGLEIVEGEAADLATFQRLLGETAARQEFRVADSRRHHEMWDVLSPADHIKLFLAMRDDQVVAALLATAFGDTVSYKRGAWSGQHGDARPNEAMQWAAISWAKEHGYRYYDLEDIEAAAAEALLRGDHPGSVTESGVTRFKLGFGGQPSVSPTPWYHSPFAPARWAVSTFGPRAAKSPQVRSRINRLS